MEKCLHMFPAFLPVISLCPVTAPVGGWWRLSGCCRCHKHCSKPKHTFMHVHRCVLLQNLGVHSQSGSVSLSVECAWTCVCVIYSHQWKAVLLGQLVCEEREQWSVRMAKSLCQRLLQDTCSTLDKVCAHVHEFNSVPVLQHITWFLFSPALCVCVCRSHTSSNNVSSQLGSS